MKIVEPSVEIIKESNALKKIEICGRVCYKSEDKITDGSARRFVENIIKRGHTSVLEHTRVKVPREIALRFQNKPIPYGGSHRICGEHDSLGIVGNTMMNARDFMSLGGTLDELAELENSPDYMTVRFICDRGISHELVRHRVFSFSQESTRYVNYNGREMEFIRPVPFEWATNKNNDRFHTWSNICENSEDAYETMIELGCSPQEARSILPNSLKTEIIMTGTFDQWASVFSLRYNNAAHPQMKYLMGLLLKNDDFSSYIDPKLFMTDKESVE